MQSSPGLDFQHNRLRTSAGVTELLHLLNTERQFAPSMLNHKVSKLSLTHNYMLTSKKSSNMTILLIDIAVLFPLHFTILVS